MSNEPKDIREDLANRFNHHSPTPSAVAAHRNVRDACHAASVIIVSNVPPGRERSLALTHLEDAMMWGNAGIARNHDKLLAEPSGS